MFHPSALHGPIVQRGTGHRAAPSHGRKGPGWRTEGRKSSSAALTSWGDDRATFSGIGTSTFGTHPRRDAGVEANQANSNSKDWPNGSHAERTEVQREREMIASTWPIVGDSTPSTRAQIS